MFGSIANPPEDAPDKKKKKKNWRDRYVWVIDPSPLKEEEEKTSKATKKKAGAKRKMPTRLRNIQRENEMLKISTYHMHNRPMEYMQIYQSVDSKSDKSDGVSPDEISVDNPHFKYKEEGGAGFDVQ